MNCSVCNKEISDDVTKCPFCDAQIKESEKSDKIDVESNSVNMEKVQSGTETTQENIVLNETKSKSKKIIIICFIAAFVLLACGGFILFKFLIRGSEGKNGLKTKSQSAYFNEDGDAIFATKDGFITLNGSYTWGASTIDQQSFVCLDDCGTLYYYPSSSSEKIKIADDAYAVEALSDYGIIYSTVEMEEENVDDILTAFMEKINSYSDEPVDMTTIKTVFKYDYKSGTVDDAKDFYKEYTGSKFPDDYFCKYHYFKYSFSENKNFELEDADYSFLPFGCNSVACVGIRENGDMISYIETTAVAKDIISTEENTEILGFTPDLNSIIYCVQDDSEDLVYEIYNDEKSKIGSLGESDATYTHYADAFYLNNYQNYVVWGLSYNSLVVGTVGAGGNTVKAGDKDIYGVYTESGEYLTKLKGNEACNTDSIFVIVKDDYKSLYEVTMSGDKEKLISKIGYLYGVINDKLIYTDDDETLYMAEWSGMKTENETKIAGDVDRVITPLNNKYIYYAKKSGDTLDVYYVDINDIDHGAEKISSDVDSVYSSNQEDVIYFIKDAEEVKDTYVYAGTLYYYSAGEEATKISSDITSLVSIYYDNYVEPSNALALKYVDTYTDDEGDCKVIYDGGVIKDNTFEKQVTEMANSNF